MFCTLIEQAEVPAGLDLGEHLQFAIDLACRAAGTAFPATALLQNKTWLAEDTWALVLARRTTLNVQLRQDSSRRTAAFRAC